MDNNQKKDKFIVTCQLGLESVLEKEINSLGITGTSCGNANVKFHGTLKECYAVNLGVRTGLHVLKHLKTFKSPDYDMLYYQARKIHWHKMFDISKSIRIDVKGRSTNLTNSQFVKHRIKDGIMDTFKKFFDSKRPDINKELPDITVTAYLSGNETSIYLDSSGISLFKRCYRTEHGEAPLKEDLAAGIILLSDWDRKTGVLDPMCGSGTFLIEAYMIANNIPPNLERNFAFQNWFDFDRNIYLSVKEKLKSMIMKSGIKFTGFEINKKTCLIAKGILKKMNLEKSISIINRDFLKTGDLFENYFIVTNPPYDERMKIDDIKGFYKQIGDFLKQRCKNSTASVFTANIDAGKFVGLRTSAKIKLFNGPLEARLLKFGIY